MLIDHGMVNYRSFFSLRSQEELEKHFRSGFGPFESEILGSWHGQWGPWTSRAPWWLKVGCLVMLKGWLGKTFSQPIWPECPHEKEVLRRGFNLFRSGPDRFHFDWDPRETVAPDGQHDLTGPSWKCDRLRLDYSHWASAMSRVKDDLRMVVAGKPGKDGSSNGLMLGKIYWNFAGGYELVRWFWLWR